MSTIRNIYSLLSAVERAKAWTLMIMILIMAFLDMLGVASILPFIAVLTNPTLIESNSALSLVYQIARNVGVGSREQFLFLLGTFVFILLVCSLIFKSITTYAQIRFALMRESSIGKRLVEGYLHQPYSWFLSRHTADLGKTILSEVQTVIYNGVLPLMTVIAQTTVAVALLCLLLLVDPLLAISVFFALALAYGSILAIMSSSLKILGEKRLVANKERYTVVSEAFGAIKEVKAGVLEEIMIDRFAKPADLYAKGQSAAQIISIIPRFAIEAVAFGGMLLVILYLMAKSGSFSDALPTIAVYAFAGYKIMPALQQIYGAITQLQFVAPALNILHADLEELKTEHVSTDTRERMPLKKSIQLKNIVYRYPNSALPALDGLSINIPARSLVGFVGATGSGKTTTIDMILGLLEPQSGRMSVDGDDLSASDLRRWKKCVGYVPQHIYLADDSITANIAFGISPEMIDHGSVASAAKMANLYDFVNNDLPNGFDTVVGERGVRLSGGQRQRIGIARALYQRPTVLILDEATSALDNLTEQAVMEAVHNLGREITIILIAHRLSTVKSCDTIFFLEKGKLKAQGTYDELTLNNKGFRLMAGLA